MTTQNKKYNTEQLRDLLNKSKLKIATEIKEDSIIKTIIINDALSELLKNHIGEENAIKIFELFEKFYNVPFEVFDVYKARYLWDIIKKLLKDMRRTNELYTIVKTDSSVYVLKTVEELNEHKTKIERHKNNLERNKQNAIIWVNSQKWRTL
jgi:hypothetical protein